MTLSEIAQKYGTTVDALVEKNGIADRNLIMPGQKLNFLTALQYQLHPQQVASTQSRLERR